MGVIHELLYRLYMRLDELGFFSPAPFDWEGLPSEERDTRIREFGEWLGRASRLESVMLVGRPSSVVRRVPHQFKIKS